MRVFVSEYICGGACADDGLDSSLAVEGKAMLLAVAADLARTRHCEVVTTWDRRLGPFPLAGVRAAEISSAADERRRFDEFAAGSDATLVIAPEFHHILANRRRDVDRVGGRFLGSTYDAIRLCSDKLALCEHLTSNSVPTIPTALFDPARPEARFEFPIVVKLQDGAGSLANFRVDDRERLTAFAKESIAGIGRESQWIQQPYVPGESLSVAVVVGRRRQIDVLPIAEQSLSPDGRFRYLGGRVPANLPRRHAGAIVALARMTVETIDGLGGYIGIDCIIPNSVLESNSVAGPCVVVEINPRLTTSYVGYRALTDDNLAERLLSDDDPRPDIRWSKTAVQFNAAGEVSPIA